MKIKYPQTVPECPICGNADLRTERNKYRVVVNFCDKCDTEIVNTIAK